MDSRAERQISLWKSKTADEDKFKLIIPYLNRLSDYLFVCARSIAESDEIWKKLQ